MSIKTSGCVFMGVGLTECWDAILQPVTQIRALRAAVGGGDATKWDRVEQNREEEGAE